MGKLVYPEVFLVGTTVLDMPGVEAYLAASGNGDFLASIAAARAAGVSDGEILCSLLAKLCYASLTLGKNKNVARVRDIPDNLRNCFDAGHGSVFEHCQLNFIAHGVSRVFTHELVRHRAGTAFSQTSGRYVRGDEVDIVFDPILEPVRADVLALQHQIEDAYRRMVRRMGLDDMTDFGHKKKVTSALRRLLPNGQSNEIGFSINLRALRHVIMLRTAAEAEWEIRVVFGQVYDLVKARYPLLFHGARTKVVDGLTVVYGMKTQPYSPA